MHKLKLKEVKWLAKTTNSSKSQTKTLCLLADFLPLNHASPEVEIGQTLLDKGLCVFSLQSQYLQCKS